MAGYGRKCARSTHIRTIGGPGVDAVVGLDRGHHRRGAGDVGGRGRMTSRRIAAMPSVRPMTNSGCGVGPLYSRTRR